jgi:hypothetical protein
LAEIDRLIGLEHGVPNPHGDSPGLTLASGVKWLGAEVVAVAGEFAAVVTEDREHKMQGEAVSKCAEFAVTCLVATWAG